MAVTPESSTPATESLRVALSAAERERNEMRAERAAISEVLRVMAASQGDVGPVFETVAAAAQRLCDADTCVALRQGEAWCVVAHVGPIPMPVGHQEPLTPQTTTGRAILFGRTEHVPDIAATDAARNAAAFRLMANQGFRAVLAVPLMRDGTAIGVIGLRRPQPGRFTDRQVALLESFADQAVIAIENARLMAELRETLEQQTAMSEILQAISRSPTDAAPVLDVLAQAAVRFCGASDAVVGLVDGDGFEFVTQAGPLRTIVGQREPLNRETALGRAMVDRATTHFADIPSLDPVEFAGAQRLASTFGFRTALAAPLLRDGQAIGAVGLRKPDPAPFTPRQIALLETFAAQAVIAIGNVRLFDELRRRTHDLQQALDQQTAISEAQALISRSALDLREVLQTLTRSATSLCGADSGVLWLVDPADGALVVGSHAGYGADFERIIAGMRERPDLNSLRIMSRVAALREPIVVGDVQSDPRFSAYDGHQVGGYRSVIGMPLLRDGIVRGVFSLDAAAPDRFGSRQLDLLRTFADQAVIAIENARLFTEVQEATRDLQDSLRQQTATSDVLKTISRSAFDLQVVFDTLLTSACRLCEAEQGIVFVREGDLFFSRATFGASVEFRHFMAETPQRAGNPTIAGRVAASGRIEHIPDKRLDPNFAPPMRATELSDTRTLLGVPMLRDGKVEGVFNLMRVPVKPFTPRQIELVQTFADQAMIAIENARLVGELRDSLDRQTATTEILQAINASPGDLQPVFAMIVEKAMTLCDAAFGMFNTFDGERFHTVATRDLPEAFVRFRADSPPDFATDSGPGRLIAGEDFTHEADMTAHPLYRAGDPNRLAMVDLAGARSILNVALRKDRRLLGMIAIYRREVRPFSEQQIALLQGFAEQAVIAMENARLLTELRQSLDQQTASAGILRVISQSPTDVQPVFDAIAESALRLLEGWSIIVWRLDGQRLRLAASAGGHPGSGEMAARVSDELPLDQSFVGEAVRWRAPQQIVDVEAENVHPALRKLAGERGWRSNLAVPLLRESQPVGVVSLSRAEPGAFDERETSLLQSFADQAVIAIENTRLFTELREALDQQTVTADILRVISQSPTDVRPVLDALVAAARRFCGGEDAVILLRDGEEVVSSAHDGVLHVIPGRRVPLDRTSTMGRAMLDAETIHHPDVALLDPVEYPKALALTREMGVRALVAAPMMSDGVAVGAVMLRRCAPGAFTPRQIELLETFAAQAVIALQNTRLFTELRESLDQQTATSEILQAISHSPGDVKPVFETILAKAMVLCDAPFGLFNAVEDGSIRTVATRGVPPEFERFRLENPPVYGPGTTPARLAAGEAFVHVHDLADSELYRNGDPARRAIVDAGGARTVLNVGLRRDDALVGMIILYRQEVKPFSDKQIALLQGFGAQAVIAMENARLLAELRRREQELRVTFDHMGDGVVMFDADLRLASWNRNFQELLDIPDAFLASRPRLDDYVTLLEGRGELGGDGDDAILRYREQVGRSWSMERVRPGGSVLEVRNNPVPGGGAVLIYSDITLRKQAEAEIRSARDAAEAALDKLKAAQANLVQSEKMASLGQLTAGIAHEIKNPLNFVNNFAALSVELLDELKEVAGPALAALDDERREQVDETMSLLTGNLDKIGEHGKRADGIVRSMLSHSRGGSGDWQVSNVNTLIEEALNLAFHGARASDKEFNVTLEREFASEAAPIEIVPQDVTRVFLNLVGNGFYAVNKRRQAGNAPGFRPTLKVMTRDLGAAVEIKVRDNGTGIPPEVRGRLFQPFFTTKPTGEGTGLGLSISYDIVTQQHGGTIEVESEPGVYTEFTVRLPRRRSRQG